MSVRCKTFGNQAFAAAVNLERRVHGVTALDQGYPPRSSNF